MLHHFTLYGFAWPFAARSFPIGVSAVPLTYSTSSAAIFASPRPLFTVMYGSVPTSRQNARNSSIPKSFGSIPLHAGFFIGARRSRSPSPTFQL